MSILNFFYCEDCGKECSESVQNKEELTEKCKECKLKEAYEIGALAMAHYYHSEYASDEFKKDHANRAMREEHIEWAKKNYRKV